MAGIVGGSGAASNGRFKGIAPECGIAALKVLDRKGNGSLKCVLSGLRWVLQYHRQYQIRIVNISVGAIPKEPGDESVLIRSVEQLWEEGLIVTVAAGNRGPKKNTVTTPGISRKVITVGCYDDVKAVEVAGSVMSDYSGRGPVAETCIVKPEVVASGFNVVSCNVISPRHPKPYTMKSGTSMATPMVSGAMALLLSKAAGISESHLKKIETGVRLPGIDTYRKLLETLEAEIVIMDKEKTVKGSCAAKIYAILQGSTEEQAVFMAEVMECMAQSLERVQ